IHGHTVAELILERVGSNKLNMGLTTWKRETMTVQDAFVAKNYLEALELKRLNLLVEQFLSFAELQQDAMRAGV
ncbi:MAG: virulence RhuM family protein, partial [Chloroflexi bacterium]|nr:virulence RhuM family protein [Chloroflexota bacterium]MYD37213.1 virulence RhuM family protein [Chloroflexota bacterium]